MTKDSAERVAENGPVSPKVTDTGVVDPLLRPLRRFESESMERIIAQLANPVSIVVPVYNGVEQVRGCVESILAETRTPFELILVDDASSDPAVADLLSNYALHGAIRVLRNQSNQGFVHSANVGMMASRHDVVLLNSDTEVSPRWLAKLIIAAYSNPKIATVTPFSNAAGAFSVPEIGVNAPIPFTFNRLKMARLTERVSSRIYPDVPTGNGFCIYIKRAVLDEMGYFDEENFGRGYGEENDFCMRARKRGWRHIIDDSLFIYHRGNSSFGEEKQKLLDQHCQTMNQLHPEYPALVRKFTRSPEINAMRDRIGGALKNGAISLELGKARLLVIRYEASSGVPMINANLVRGFDDTHQCFLLTSTDSEMILRAWQEGCAIEQQRWQLAGKWLARNCQHELVRRIYFQVITGLGTDLVHISRLFKHASVASDLCGPLGIPVVS